MFSAFCFRMNDIGPLCFLLLTLGALVQISPGFLLTGGNTHNIRFKICNVWLPRIIIWFFFILNRLHLNHARRVFGWDYFWNVTKTYTYFYSEFFYQIPVLKTIAPALFQKKQALSQLSSCAIWHVDGSTCQRFLL